jgi:translation initiation factor IF-3
LSRPFSSRFSSPAPSVRVNGKIRSREVRVIGLDGKQLGILSLPEALNAARSHGVDLVEIAPTATPPVCRIVDFGKFRYEQAKKDKESKKHQHASTVKEVQLTARIDPHDLGVKLEHAIDFLTEDMKVKVVLKFRGRELAHPEFGHQVVSRFLSDIAPYGHRDFEPKLVGRSINVMISPLPRNKRAKNPRLAQEGEARPAAAQPSPAGRPEAADTEPKPDSLPAASPRIPPAQFNNNPFAGLDFEASPAASPEVRAAP